MSKLTRDKILIRSLAAAAATVTAIATIVETTSEDDFSKLRSLIAEAISGPYLFWFFAFVIVWFFSIIATFWVQYSKLPHRHGSILSQDGILLFDREQHIAFSIKTLKSLILELAGVIPNKTIKEILFKSGVAAGVRFGSNFSEIYREQIEPTTTISWEELGDNEKLDAWEKYDATDGWGRISAHKFEFRSRIEITVRHPSLFKDSGGELLSMILAGYCQAVCQALLERTVVIDDKASIENDDGIIKFLYRINT